MLKLVSMNNFQVLLALSMLIFFSACQKDSNNANHGTMLIQVDSIPQTVTNIDVDNTLLHLEQYTVAGRRLDIRATIGNATLTLSASNWDFQTPPTDGILTKTYDTNTDLHKGPNQICGVHQSIPFCDGGLATYVINGRTFSSQKMDNKPHGAIVITQNNTAKKTISGTFDVLVRDFLQPNAQPIHLTGTFSDVSYKVVP